MKRNRFYVGSRDYGMAAGRVRDYWPIYDRNYMHPVSPAWVWGTKEDARIMAKALNDHELTRSKKARGRA